MPHRCSSGQPWQRWNVGITVCVDFAIYSNWKNETIAGKKVMKRKGPEREQEILSATLRALRNNGVTATSTAKIAAEANCSKETLYNWFGDRDGLYAALIRAQSKAFNDVLVRVVEKGQSVREKLELYSGSLLDMLTGEANCKIVQLAIGQSDLNSSQIRSALIDRQEILSVLGIDLLVQAREQGLLKFSDPEEAYSILYGLLVGRRQIDVISGIDDARPSGEEMANIATIAVDRLLMIYV